MCHAYHQSKKQTTKAILNNRISCRVTLDMTFVCDELITILMELIGKYARAGSSALGQFLGSLPIHMSLQTFAGDVQYICCIMDTCLGEHVMRTRARQVNVVYMKSSFDQGSSPMLSFSQKKLPQPILTFAYLDVEMLPLPMSLVNNL